LGDYVAHLIQRPTLRWAFFLVHASNAPVFEGTQASSRPTLPRRSVSPWLYRWFLDDLRNATVLSFFRHSTLDSGDSLAQSCSVCPLAVVLWDDYSKS